VKSFLHTWFRTGRQRNQEAFLFDYHVKSFLHTWFRTGRQQFHEAFLFDYLVQSFLNLHSTMPEKKKKLLLKIGEDFNALSFLG
jgi:hypothetical protein